MAATTTPSISWLLSQLEQHLPGVTLVKGQDFAWAPTTRTITYSPAADNAAWQLLHEAGHAIYQHSKYRRDIELLGYEVEAWAAAAQLSDKLGIEIPEDIIDEHIDTYRDWLHSRSQCPACAQTGIQTSSDGYRCLHCPAKWRVNDSRQCGLRRYQTT